MKLQEVIETLSLKAAAKRMHGCNMRGSMGSYCGRDVHAPNTWKHMGCYGCGPDGMRGHDSGRAMSYLCTRNPMEKKMRFSGK